MKLKGNRGVEGGGKCVEKGKVQQKEKEKYNVAEIITVLETEEQ